MLSYLDYAQYATGFQDPASDWFIAMIDLHDQIIFYLIIILTLVLWITISGIINSARTGIGHYPYLAHGNMVELVWTVTPALILWAIGIPSLRLLYLMDEILDPEITVKVIGSQWFWSYEFTSLDGSINQFDSFMVGLSDLKPGDLRQLAVDSFLVLPTHTAIRLLVSSNDVIHSFALPSLGLKVDAIPGRLNLAGLIINRSGTFYGQCSELCGVLHGFMPIGIQAVSLSHYYSSIISIAPISLSQRQSKAKVIRYQLLCSC